MFYFMGSCTNFAVSYNPCVSAALLSLFDKGSLNRLLKICKTFKIKQIQNIVYYFFLRVLRRLTCFCQNNVLIEYDESADFNSALVPRHFTDLTA